MKKILVIIAGIVVITGGYLGLKTDDKCKNEIVQIHIIEDQYFCGTEEQATAFRAKLIQELPLFRNNLDTYNAMIAQDDEFYTQMKMKLKENFDDSLLELHMQAYKTRFDYETYVKQKLIVEINTPKPDGDYDFDINRRGLVTEVIGEELKRSKKLPKTKEEYVKLFSN